MGNFAPSGVPDSIAQQIVDALTTLNTTLAQVASILSDHSREYLSTDECAEVAGVTPYTVRRWIREGRIAATRVQGSGPKGHLLIPRDQLNRLVESGD